MLNFNILIFYSFGIIVYYGHEIYSINHAVFARLTSISH